MLKNFSLMVFIFLSWWVPSFILPFEITIYNVLWIIIFFFITLSTFTIINKNKLSNNYICFLLINYLYCHSFRIFFVHYYNTFYASIIFVVSIITSVIWVCETRKIDKSGSYYLLPYLFGVTSLLLLFIY